MRKKSKMADENRPYIRNGSTDLHEIWQDDALCVSELDRKLKFPILKIQDGGQPPFLQIENRP